MRRLGRFLGILSALTLLGYFIYLNNHNVPLYFFYTQSIHLSLWVIMSLVLIMGALFAFGYQLVTHPNLFIQRVKSSFAKTREHKRQQWFHAFYDACAQKNWNLVQQSYAHLQRQQTLPLALRIQYLQQYQAHASTDQVAQGFQELKEQFPSNLQLLIPYQCFARQNQDWSLVEVLSQEIQMKAPNHPEALRGFAQLHAHREEWGLCVQKEILLLKHLGQSWEAEQYLATHLQHLLKALQYQPQMLSQLKFNYLPISVQFKQTYRLSLLLAEAQQLEERNQFYPAAQQLKKAYQQTGAPVCLDHLERVFFASNRNEKILTLFRKLQHSSQTSDYVLLALTRLLFRADRLDEAKETLTLLESYGAPKLLLYSALKTLIHEDCKVAKPLAESLLEHPYHCNTCHTHGPWEPVCPNCNAIYAYGLR